MNERGGAIYGFLAAIGLVVVLIAIVFAGCFANAGASQPRSAPAVERHRQCDDDWGDCDQGGGYGNGDRNSKGRDGDSQRGAGHDQCHSFCGNTVIIPMPGDTTTTTTGQARPEAVSCLVPVPWHCDRKPS